MAEEENFDLIGAVVPEGGYYAVLGINDNTVQRLVSEKAEAYRIADMYAAQGRNAFFGLASFENDQSRTKSNVRLLKALWLDVDCGEGKPYATQADGRSALDGFLLTSGLPQPVIINSGRGLHVYFPLTEAISRQKWEPLASKLASCCQTNGLEVDPAVFEVARVLRVPGTKNFKDDPPSDVEVLQTGDPTPYADICSILGVDPTKQTELIDKPREMSDLGKMLAANNEYSFSKIMRRSMTGKGCEQLRQCEEDRQSLSEPRWFDALSIAKFCRDADKAIHKISEGHPDYDPHETQRKIAHIVGPHTCETFERHNPGYCEGCPFAGKIKSPIVLGKELAVAAGTVFADVGRDDAGEDADPFLREDVEDGRVVIPEPPFPYQRGKNGGIYLPPADEEDEPMLVCDYDLYPVKRLIDPEQGDITYMRLHMPSDGIRSFMIPNHTFNKAVDLASLLASQGVLASDKQHRAIRQYLLTYVKTLQHSGEKAKLMRKHFGWADRDSKFIIGDREITPNGVFYSPVWEKVERFAENMTVNGDLERWKEVWRYFNKAGQEDRNFACLTAFGAPIFKFTKFEGAWLNLIHSSSGTGKSTILHMVNSVYGNPKGLTYNFKDTANARELILGVHNSMPFTVDEMTNTSGKEISDMLYAVTQGHGKERMNAQSNSLRSNVATWRTLGLSSSNASFYEKLENGDKAKKNPEGEFMRLIEYHIEPLPHASHKQQEEAYDIFRKLLLQNYGHAGEVYAQYLVNNVDTVQHEVEAMEKRIAREINMHNKERFWVAYCAANLVGGQIAKHRCNLIDWDMGALYTFACEKLIPMLRGQLTPPPTSVATTISDYINRHISNVLVIKGGVDARAKGVKHFPLVEPRNELLIRWEPDTKVLALASGAFKRDCVNLQINVRELEKQLKAEGVLIDQKNFRLGRGLDVVSGPTRCLLIDCSNPEFMELDIDIPEEDADDASSGG